MNLSRFREENGYGPLHPHRTHQRRRRQIPFVSVQFSKNHRPIPTAGATYYLRPSDGDKRTPIKIGKDISLAQTAIIRMEDGRSLDTSAALRAEPPSSVPATPPRKTVAEARPCFVLTRVTMRMRTLGTYSFSGSKLSTAFS